VKPATPIRSREPKRRPVDHLDAIVQAATERGVDSPDDFGRLLNAGDELAVTLTGHVLKLERAIMATERRSLPGYSDAGAVRARASIAIGFALGRAIAPTTAPPATDPAPASRVPSIEDRLLEMEQTTALLLLLTHERSQALSVACRQNLNEEDEAAACYAVSTLLFRTLENVRAIESALPGDQLGAEAPTAPTAEGGA